jgi:hypothetical protein
MGFDWSKALALAGGAAATAALIYYLLQDEPAGGSAGGGAKGSGEMNKTDLLKLLNEIVASQSDMSNLMKEITDFVLKENLTFEQVYQRVKARLVILWRSVGCLFRISTPCLTRIRTTTK